MPATAPNIVYIHSHDTGRYVQPYGYAIATPTIQRLAEQGVLFRQAHCAGPTCSPSRAALLTGQSPHSAGMLGLAHRGFTLADYRQHVCHTLRYAGYFTAIAGFQHLALEPFARPADMGYERFLNHQPNGRCDNKQIEHAAADFLRSAPKQPFFLDVGFIETHRINGPHGMFVSEDHFVGEPRYVAPPANLPDVVDVRRDMADYAVSATQLDRKISVVIDALDASGLAENTLVLCTTDHGIPFPGMKCSLTDHGTGVMLVMRGPGGFAGGKVSDALVSHIDLFPTLCDLAGTRTPAWVEGRSLLPIVRDGAAEVNEAVYSEVNFHSAYEPMRSVRTQRWKYIRRFDDRGRRVLPNIDNSPSKRYLVAQGWADEPLASECLFDLVLDPQEARNLVNDPRAQSALAEMRKRLDDWMRRTNDPLLKGPLQPLPQWRVTPQDAYSPDGTDAPPELPAAEISAS